MHAVPRSWLPAIHTLVCVLIGLTLSATASAADTDLDGLDDTVDNCTEYFNPQQLDSDGDLYGNECDGDLNNDGLIDLADYGLLQANVGLDIAAFDYIRDGIVSSADLDYWNSSLYGAALGPSGRADAGPYWSDGVILADADGDGWPEFSSDPNEVDLCPNFYNADANGDLDGDGIGDGCDLCVNHDDSLTPGVDTDGDGIGNACDADYDNNGVTSVLDFSVFISCFQAVRFDIGSACAEVDATGDGIVTVLDFVPFLRQFIDGHPGESGLDCSNSTAQSAVCPAYGDLYDRLDGWLGDITTVDNYLLIDNIESLTNLDGLENLTDVSGDIIISNNAALTNIDGLSNLTSVTQGIRISDNATLSNVNGLLNITELNSSMSIYNNAALTNLNGLASLVSVNQNLSIHDNPELTNVDGLESLSSVQGSITIQDNPMLANIDGLGSLEWTLDDLTIANNAALTNIDGLSVLVATSHSIIIDNNEVLADVSGLGSLQSIRSLYITNNPSLTHVEGLGYQLIVDGDIIISGNDALTDIDGFGNLEESSGLTISNNATLINLGQLSNDTLIYNDVFIQDNASLCQDEAVDFGANCRIGYIWDTGLPGGPLRSCTIAGAMNTSNNAGVCP